MVGGNQYEWRFSEDFLYFPDKIIVQQELFQPHLKKIIELDGVIILFSLVVSYSSYFIFLEKGKSQGAEYDKFRISYYDDYHRIHINKLLSKFPTLPYLGSSQLKNGILFKRELI